MICFYLETNLGIDVSSAYSLVESYSRDRFYKLGFPFYPLVLLLSTLELKPGGPILGIDIFVNLVKGLFLR